MSIIKIPCCIIRGGTSKAVYIEGIHLPKEQDRKDRLLLSLFGSPDIRQIDGLGGADPLTSKVAIVYKSNRDDIDVEFLSAEIGIKEPLVNYGIMCGNSASGVGYFAIEQGLIKARSPETTIRIYCRNNNKIIISRIPVEDGYPVVEGDDEISGVPGGAAATWLEFIDPAGAITGRLLPTGNPKDCIAVKGKKFEISIIDSGTLYAFIHARDLGLEGNESPDELDNKPGFIDIINDLRKAIASHINSVNTEAVLKLSEKQVKIALIAKPVERHTLQGKLIKPSDVDILATIINPLNVHKAYAVSGGICLATASVVKGSLVNEVIQTKPSPMMVVIGHPSGTFDVKINYAIRDETLLVLGVEVKRTARVIMNGTAYVKI